MDNGEFYQPIENTRREIASLNIPECKKEELYLLTDKIVKENEISEQREQKTKSDYEQLAEISKKMFDSLNQINSAQNTILPQLKSSTANSRIERILKNLKSYFTPD